MQKLFNRACCYIIPRAQSNEMQPYIYSLLVVTQGLLFIFYRKQCLKWMLYIHHGLMRDVLTEVFAEALFLLPMPRVCLKIRWKLGAWWVLFAAATLNA